MNDQQKAAESLKKIQDIQNRIRNHTSRISQIENEKRTKIRYFDQQIQSEQQQIARYTKEINDLKRYV